MQQCAEHIQYQLPNEHSRVGFLLEAIQCLDPGLQAAMASVKTDPDGMRNDFEAAASHLLPYDPVAKKRTAGNKRSQASISDLEAKEADVGSATAKASIGKTGVHFRWHTMEEYKQLSGAQKRELYEWQQANPNFKRPSTKFQPAKSKGAKRYTKKQLSSLVSKRVKLELSQREEAKQEQDGEAYVMSLIQKVVADGKPKANASSAAAPPEAPPLPSALRSILKRAQHKPS